MSNTPLRIIFAGTPEFAASSLQAVIEAGHDVVAVYTQPDRPAGRGRKLKPSAVKALALEHNLPVEQPLSLKDADSQQTLAATGRARYTAPLLHQRARITATTLAWRSAYSSRAAGGR